ncbi:hypothetical protein PACILC2_22670 [Paenibacillus cisolokensis]|uniref:HNH nuclease domain-containing protein n=1 Tax=Paenibacillus cisolokensis TaxID=1658519 RepID=A0ABQ4N659_9BACL|nr:HNH endonuclease signature motif containing protein [Paenibacillus cisolokensis]GIQ63699.1 hypothetical protein PACILC2_22670 [Paenibacillus cisolokensis]
MTEADREFHRKRVREYREQNPHTPFYTTSRYQAKKAGAFSDLTMEDAYDIYHTPDICAYCGKERGPDDGPRSFHIDHVIPLKQGGPNSRWNLVKVCASCNSSKETSSLIDFYNRKPEFTKARYDAVVKGMAEKSGFSETRITELLLSSHEFELAIEREKARMQAEIARFYREISGKLGAKISTEYERKGTG